MTAATNRRWIVAVLLVLLAAAGASFMFAVRRDSRERAKKERETAYQSALKAYSREIKPGSTRKEVEDYLRAHNAVFTQMYGVSLRESLVDLVKIGEDDHPWYCNENWIYVAFDFVEQPPPLVGHNSDILKGVSIFPMLGGCL